MATGDVVIFHGAKAYLLEQGWQSTDTIKCAILNDDVTPSAAEVNPTLTSDGKAEVGTGGSYLSGGISLGTAGRMFKTSGATLVFSSVANPTWPQNAGNDNNAGWGLIYNATDGSGRAIAYVELGAPVDMSTGTLTITWHTSGIFAIT